MTTLDFAAETLSSAELKQRVAEAVYQRDKEAKERYTAIRMNEATYRKIQTESPGMKMFETASHDTETFFGLRIIIA